MFFDPPRAVESREEKLIPRVESGMTLKMTELEIEDGNARLDAHYKRRQKLNAAARIAAAYSAGIAAGGGMVLLDMHPSYTVMTGMALYFFCQLFVSSAYDRED